MILYGLTGGIGSGKSTAARILAQKRFPILSADDLSRDILTPHTEQLQQLVAAFGPEILTPSGELNRPRLARLAFSDTTSQKKLNSITHPAILNRSQNIFKRLSQAGQDLLIYEATLLFETGRHQEMDRIILITAPTDQRIARVCARDNCSEQEVLQRMAHQMHDNEKRDLSDYIIDNSSTLTTFKEKVETLANKLLQESLRLREQPIP